MALPSIDEQNFILSFLDTEIAKFDSQNLESHRAVVLIRERRTALSSAAVTGKIDVRACQPFVDSVLEQAETSAA